MANICNDFIESIYCHTLKIQEDSITFQENHSASIQDHQANAAITNQMALITAIQNQQNQISELNINQNNGNNGRYRNCGCGNNCNNNSSNRRCLNTSKYCWTHGACAHGSNECKSPTDGHKSEATFENKMGGSSAYCGQRN